MRWGRKVRKEPGWAAVEIGAQDFAFVHAVQDGTGRPKILEHGAHSFGAERDALARLVRETGLDRCRCATLLESSRYQLLMLDAPALPREEWAAAARWRIKDFIDYKVEEAAVQVLEIPVVQDAPAPGHRQMFAVAAPNGAIADCVGRFEAAAMPLEAIDIPELAQRNLAALCEEPGRAVGLVYFGTGSGLFTVSCGGELYMSRRIEIGADDLCAGSEDARATARERVLLELQRSLDHFERQNNQVPVARIVLGPEPSPSGLAEFLGSQLALRVATLDIGAVLELPEGGLHPRLAWRYFHLFGASLRPDAAAN
jgi:MSHA biogenesis protein MshI